MSTITVSLYLVNGDLQESSSNDTNPAPQPGATTNIVSGDTIIWVLGNDSGISSIDSITAGLGLTFTPKPAPPNWTFVVTGKNTQPGEEPYHYDIGVTPSVGGPPKLHDPKIKVNPGTSVS